MSFGGVVVELVVAVTGAVLSPLVAGWFAPAASPDWAWIDGTAATGFSAREVELSGTVGGSAALGCGWALFCGEDGEDVVAPSSSSLGSCTPDSGWWLGDMAVLPRWQMAIDGDPLGKRTLSTGLGKEKQVGWGRGRGKTIDRPDVS